MSRPKILRHVDSKDNPHEPMNWVSTEEEEVELGDTLPVNADTLEGHPASYFASKTEVNQAISNYISTVLGRSY